MRVFVPLWVVLLAALSLAPEDIKYHLGTKGPFHYTAHFVAFTLTGLIFCWQANSFMSRLIRALAACGVALGLEALEAWFYNNRLEWFDVLIGCFGVLLGFAVATILQTTKVPAWFVRK